jgi:hypothetical protein
MNVRRMHRTQTARTALVAILTLLAASPAWAFRFSIGDEIDGSWAHVFTVGGSWRMQDRSSGLVGKSNLDPGLCTSEARCIGSQDDSLTAEQLEYLNAPGQYSINSDDGNLNFDKYDLVAGTAKLTSDLSLSWRDFGLFVRTYLFYDTVYTDFVEFHPNRANGPAPEDRGPERTPWPGELRNEIGTSLEFMDAYVFGHFPLGETRDLYWRVGSNLVNWGESTFLVINSINTINPPLENRIFVPGFDVKEVFVPVPMVHLGTNLTDTLSGELFYQLKWKGLRTAPPGSFFSTSDIGVPGGTFASLPYGSNAEDPHQLERIQGPGNLIEFFDLTRTSLTILRQPDRRPSDSGQYGVGVKWFAEALGNTELGFYYLNYHSRLPMASVNAAYRSCLRPADGSEPDQFDVLDCSNLGNTYPDTPEGKRQKYEDGNDLLPADSVDVFLEYPENIRLYGLSFNTNFGDFAIQGEYAFRPNLPVQVDLEDMVNAALHPAFPRENVDLLSLLTGLPPTGAVVIAGQEIAVPNLIESVYRGNADIQPRQYIRGYENLKVGQFDASVTYVFGPGNLIMADQIIALAEVGFTHILDFPSKDRVVFEGPGTFTAPFPGRRELDNQLAINPEQQRSGYVTEFSWGYRLFLQPSYKAILNLFTYEPNILFFHDMKGVAPGPGGNFVEGRREIHLLNNFLYQSYRATLGYTWFTGGGDHNLRRDRDYATFSLRYEF